MQRALTPAAAPLLLRPDDVLSSVRAEPVEALRRAQGERFILHRAASVGYGRLALLCGSVTAAIGVLILAGWWLDLAALKIAPAGTVAMKANTALAFALAGAALVLLAGAPAAPRRARAGRWLALPVVLIGGLTLCEFLFGWRLGIDELLFKDVPGAVAPSGPGRMAPPTATCFVLLGLALIGIEWEPRPGFRPAELLALIAAIVSLTALGEYAIGQPVFYGFGRYARMALLTAAIFFALSIGVLLARPTQGVVAALRAGRIGAQEQASYSALGLALLAVAAGGAWYYHAQEQQARREVEAELEVIARLKVEQIAQWRAERLADGAVLMDSGFFAEGVWRWMAAPRAGLEETIRRRFDLMLQSNRYQNAVLVDTRGQVRLATSDKTAALHGEEFQALASALRERRPVLSDLHTRPSAPMPHANLVVPLFRKVGAGSAPIGAVVLMIDAQQFLYPLIRSWPTSNPSAETLLVRRDGDDALFINGTRHHPDAALKLRIPLSRTEVPAVMAVLGKEGVFEGNDYRGVKVLSVLRAIPDSPWFMVAKIDEADALAAWRSHATLIVALTLALAAAASMVWQQKSKYRALSRSAATLRESEELFRSAMQYSTVGMALVAPDGHWLEVNDAVCEMLGYSRDELLATNFQAVTHPDDLNADLEQVRAMLERRITSYRMEKRYLHKTGRIVWAQLGVSLVRHADGQARNFISQIQDITERRRAEEDIRELNEDLEQRVAERTEQLAKSESRIRLLLDSTGEAIYGIDSNGECTFCNPACVKILGYRDEAELLGRNMHALIHHHRANGSCYPVEECPIFHAFRAGTGARADDEVFWRADGSSVTVDYSAHPLLSGGAVTGAVIVFRDVSERKRTQELLQANRRQIEAQNESLTRTNARLETANRAKSDFLANMSHELRTPLNSIIGFSEMLKDGVLGELNTKQSGFISDIFGAGTHLLSLINDILDLSKVEAGMLQLEAGVVDLAALLKASTLVVREKALAHRIRLDTQLDPALGAMLADERKLKQIVYNLLANAVKFTPEGGAVTLAARRCMRSEVVPEAAMPVRLVAPPPGEDREFLAITVEDNGVGIAEADLAKLFEPFTQVDSSVARHHAGTGLGLSLVRRLAELHGGTVGVASRPGEGSRFSVWLPYREFAGAGESAGPLAVARPAVPLALVIEDDDRMADLITAQLRAEGFAVMRAATGEEGLVRAAKHPPQIITLDIFLPAMDGWEFMRRLKAQPKLADTPVVIITVSADLDRGLALGARRVLQKPFARGELVAAFAGLVDARPAGEGARVLVVDDDPFNLKLALTVLAQAPDLVLMDVQMPGVAALRGAGE